MLPSEIPKLSTDQLVRGFPGVWKLPPSFKTPSPACVSIPNSFVSLFIFYILSYFLSKTMGCFSGCLMSSASVQKLFCGICSPFKCSFDEFVGTKVISPSYSSAILGLPSLPLLNWLPYCTQTCQSKIQLGQSLITIDPFNDYSSQWNDTQVFYNHSPYLCWLIVLRLSAL